MKKAIAFLLSALLTFPLPALAEDAAGIHLDGAAFVDSLQYMLKGMAGIFLVTGLIILAVLILEKATAKKRDGGE